MGLDSIEFVMEVEDEFGLKIPDEEVQQMQTVGDTVRYIVEGHGLDVSASDPNEARQVAALRP